MAILTAAVIVVGALCLTDLLLSFGIIRRLRQQAEILSQQAAPGQATVLPLGSKPAPFAATTTAGEPVAGPAGPRVAAFFSSSCRFCPEKAHLFVEYLRTSRVPRETVLAVLATDGEQVPYHDALAEVAQVCTESPDGDLQAAFGVTGYPTFCLLAEDGALITATHDPLALRGLVTA